MTDWSPGNSKGYDLKKDSLNCSQRAVSTADRNVWRPQGFLSTHKHLKIVKVLWYDSARVERYVEQPRAKLNAFLLNESLWPVWLHNTASTVSWLLDHVELQRYKFLPCKKLLQFILPSTGNPVLKYTLHKCVSVSDIKKTTFLLTLSRQFDHNSFSSPFFLVFRVLELVLQHLGACSAE